MKRIKSLLALLLALTMILTLLSACSKKEPEPSSDPGKTVTTPAQQNNEPNNTDTMTTTSSSQQNEEPAVPSDTETPSDAQPEPEPEKPTYGGVQTSMIISFMYITLMSEQTIKNLAFGEDMIDRIESEYNGFAHDYEKMPDETAKWLDEIFLESIGIDYSGISKDELDEIRNMVLVIRAKNGFYFGIPEDEEMFQRFLGEAGMEIYQRWNTKLENRSDRLLDQIMNENEAIIVMRQANAAYLEAEFGPTQSKDFEITNLVVDTVYFETNGDTYFTVTVSCPELTGSNITPTISLIFFDDDGKEIDHQDTLGRRGADEGLYTCCVTFNTVKLGTDVPLEGHVYAYRSVSGSQYSTVDDCKFVY